MSANEGPTVYRGASAKAVRHHYDLSNEFYRLWLDPDLTYSCALWMPGDTLESAQNRKLDYLIDGAQAAGADRVLDVGCGWGSLLRRLTQTHGVRLAVGLTLSRQQANWVNDLSLPHCAIKVENWVDHMPDLSYDAIISIGAFEHFTRPGLPRDQRVAAHRHFFETCRSWLPPNRRLALQSIVRGSNPRVDRQTVRDLLFIRRMIFPESQLPRISEILEASEGLFELVSIRNDPDHYAHTTQQWLSCLREHRTDAVELVGETTTANYERYLGLTSMPFRTRLIGLTRIIFEAI